MKLETDPTLAAPAPFDDTLMSVERALSERERISLHWIAGIGALLFVMAALVVPFVGRWTTLKWCLELSLPLGAILSLWVFLRTKTAERYTPAVMHAAVVGIAFPVIVNTLYFGIFSPALLILFLYIYLSCMSSPTFGTAIYVLIAVGHGALATLMLGGKLPMQGLVTLSVTGAEALLGEMLTQSALFAGLVVGRGSRQSSIQALEKLHSAKVEAARRDVVAREVAAQLLQAQGPGDRGYLSGAAVGPYRIGNLLGRGGMGEVYEARHSASGERVALKILSPTITQTDNTIQRFQRECAALRQLRHDNVVEMLDIGTTESGLPYLVMELLQGRDLAMMLRDEGTLPPNATLRLVREVGAGLDHARAHGIVHRDLKPQNLFFSHSQQRWKILDFGIAKILDVDDATLTHGYIIGTPTYMSPEHASSRPVDHRADLYALSALAYRTLTGFPVFSASTAPALVHAVVYEFPRMPSTLADLPPDVDRVLAIGLAKSADERFQSGAELADALAAAFDSNLDRKLRRRGDRQLALWAGTVRASQA